MQDYHRRLEQTPDPSDADAFTAFAMLKILDRCAEGIAIRHLLNPAHIRGKRKGDRVTQFGQRHRRARRRAMFLARLLGIPDDQIRLLLSCTNADIDAAVKLIASNPLACRTCSQIAFGLEHFSSLGGQMGDVIAAIKRIEELASHRSRIAAHERAERRKEEARIMAARRAERSLGSAEFQSTIGSLLGRVSAR